MSRRVRACPRRIGSMVENFAGDSHISKQASADPPEKVQLINQLAMEMASSSKDALSSPAAPNTLIGRYGLVTVKGIGNLPSGILHAGEDAINHPLRTLETVGSAALMGAALKTILPETGNAGKIAGLAIGAYFTYQSARPFVESYKMAGQARTMKDIDVAAVHLGDVGGSFIVNSAIAGAGYKLGAAGAERVLLRPELDGFADMKQAFWDGVGEKTGRLTDALGITSTPEPVKTAAAVKIDPRMGEVQKFMPSDRTAPEGTLKGEVPDSEKMHITIQLKSRSSDLAMDRALKRIALGRAQPMTDAEFSAKFGASQESLDAVTKFANENGLAVRESNLASGRVVLSGTAGKMSEAFQTKINNYDLDGFEYTGREGALTVPKTMAGHIEGIFGMDDRPQAHPYVVKLEDVLARENNPSVKKIVGRNPGDPPATGTAPKPVDGVIAAPTEPVPGRGPIDPKKVAGYMPNEVADAYEFPKGTTGKGGGVAIIELGGGIDMQNEAAYYKAHGLKMPDIKVIEIDGAKNSPGNPKSAGADGEVALDSQVVGAVAPDAKQALIFAPNSDRGFMDAITRATFPEKGENPNQAISISWGAPMETWSDQGKRGMNLAFKKAALKGISVFAASGDDGAIDAAPSGNFNVDYPAADPYNTGTGGTRLVVKDGKIVSEVAWNNGRNKGSGGGGISPDEIPDYQKDLKMPPNASNNHVLGRGVPDIAGNADPVTGYRIRVAGTESVMGGTSAVAPLMSALAVRLNEGLGNGQQVGFMNPFLYKNGMAGTGTFFNDVTSGHNNGYATSPGWDAVTGWGSLNGEKLLAAYKGEGTTLSARLMSMVPAELKSGRDIIPIPMNVGAPAGSDRNKAG
jgi:kumamolisin